MNYIQRTIGLLLILSIDKYGNIKWYVDSAFAVYKDVSSHTGGLITMGTRGKYLKSSKQKFNTKSSVEDKLVVVYDFLAQMIWTRYSLKYQGYDIHDNVIYQDN